jgi:hypothetical protein
MYMKAVFSLVAILMSLYSVLFTESVKITQQPEATPGVEGQQLILECRATGVPRPNFLWFKAPNTPLPEQTADTLFIQSLAKEDAGKYCCRAENEVNTVFSPWVEVKVQKPHILNNGTDAVCGLQHVREGEG